MLVTPGVKRRLLVGAYYPTHDVGERPARRGHVSLPRPFAMRCSTPSDRRRILVRLLSQSYGNPALYTHILQIENTGSDNQQRVLFNGRIWLGLP